MDLNLVDAFELVFDGLFDGDDLVRVGIDFGQGRIQRGGFTRTGGAGDQHNAVGTCEQLVKALQGICLKAHGLEAVAHAVAVEYPHDHTLAMHGGDGGNAQIQLAAFDTGFDAPVLRQAALGNVQVRHEFDAGVDRCAQLRVDHFFGANHAVNPVAHMQAVVKGFEVNVRGPHVDDAADDLGDQADHRRFAGEVFQVFDKVTGIGVEPVVFFGVGFILAGQRLFNVGGHGHAGVDLQSRGQRQRLTNEIVRRVGHGHSQTRFVLLERVNQMGAQIVGLQTGHLGHDVRKVLGGDKRQGPHLRLRLRHVYLGDQSQIDQYLVEHTAGFVTRAQGAVEVTGRQFAGTHQQLTQPIRRRGECNRLGFRGFGHGAGRGSRIRL